MISLAGRDILHSWGKFVLTGIGLGLLIGVTLTMAGVYRGMVDDARALLNNSGADLWVVQQDTQGPYAESSSLRDDAVRSVLGMPGVARAANVTYLTMQVRRATAHPQRPAADDVRAMVVGFEPGQPGEPGYLVAGRHITRSHYEAVADVRTGFALGERIRIRRHDYTVVGLTRRMVSSGGDPMVFIPLKDAQEAQFLKDNEAIVNERARTAANPSLNRPGVPGCWKRSRPRRRTTATSTPSSCRCSPALTPSAWPNRCAAGSTWRRSRASRWKRSWWPS
jgi:putative ABC transport system permease protein